MNMFDNTSESDVVLSLPLQDGSFFDVESAYIAELSFYYPTVDIIQELRKMLGWLNANITKRKTRVGIKKFINSWLVRSLDRLYCNQLVANRAQVPANRQQTQVNNSFCTDSSPVRSNTLVIGG